MPLVMFLFDLSVLLLPLVIGSVVITVCLFVPGRLPFLRDWTLELRILMVLLVCWGLARIYVF